MNEDKTIDQMIEEKHIDPLLDKEEPTVTPEPEPEAKSEPEPVATAKEPTPVEPSTEKKAQATEPTASVTQPATTQPQKGQLKDDGKGNLVDAATGNVVAKAGAERRHYERAEHLNSVTQRQAGYIKQLEAQRSELSKAAELSSVLNGAPAKLGLTNQEVEAGLAVFASWKKDPITTLKYLIDETRSSGYDVSAILGGQQGNPTQQTPDVRKIVSDVIDQRFGKQFAAQDAEIRAKEAAATAEREYTAFVAKHPYAQTHEDTLSNMLVADSQLSPELAYYQLQAWAASNGYDFTKPLKPQVEARRATPQQPSTTSTPTPPPLATGRTHGAMVTDSAPISAEAFTDDIVRQAMKEAGLDIGKI